MRNILDVLKYITLLPVFVYAQVFTIPHDHSAVGKGGDALLPQSISIDNGTDDPTTINGNSISIDGTLSVNNIVEQDGSNVLGLCEGGACSLNVPAFSTFSSRADFTASGGSAGSLRINANGPAFEIRDTGSATDEERWVLSASSEALRWAAKTDSGTSNTFWEINRTSNQIDTIAWCTSGDNCAMTGNGALTVTDDLTVQGDTIDLTNGGSPRLYISDSNEGSDEKVWGMGSSGTGGSLRISTFTDAKGAGNDAINIQRTGTGVDEVQICTTGDNCQLDVRGNIILNGEDIYEPINAFRTADNSRSSDTTMTVDEVLAGTLAVGSYRYEAMLVWDSASATPDVDFRISKSSGSGTVADYNMLCLRVEGQTNQTPLFTQDSASGEMNVNLGGSNPQVTLCHGSITVVTDTLTAGVIWAQSTSNATASVLEEGSYITFKRI